MAHEARLSPMEPLGRPVVLYDGRCPICRAEVQRLVRLCGRRIATETLQAASAGDTIPDEIKLLMPGGRVYGGMDAIVRALALHPAWRLIVWAGLLPGVRAVARAGYRWVARNRYRLSAAACGGECALHAAPASCDAEAFLEPGAGTMESPSPALRGGESFRRSAKLFHVLFGLVYVSAFAGLYVQVLPLVGSEGLLPAAEAVALHRVGTVGESGDSDEWLPTVFVWNASDSVLRGGCVLGMALGAAAAFGLFRRACLVLLGVLYVSYVTVGQTFFYFQWDGLLIEMTLHALLLRSYSVRLLRRGARGDHAARRQVPHPIVVFLMQWLLFRVYFESGLAKVLADGGGWTDLSAMKYYYDTAPLPTWIGWYAHNLPAWWHEVETALALLVELLLPVFIFSRRAFRTAVFLVFTGFQLAILLTANYGLFNYLTLLLGLFLLQDRDYETVLRPWRRIAGRLARRFHGRRSRPVGPEAGPPLPSLVAWLLQTMVLFAAACLIVTASLVEMAQMLLRRDTAARVFHDPATRCFLGDLQACYRDARLINSYHLFAGMTRERLVPEIQGLNDKGEWVAYPYRWAPAELDVAPRLVAPYHPRLDFQIWFVTLSGPPSRHAYFVRLLEKLCSEPAAAATYFASDPFPESGPRKLRVMIYLYKMTDDVTRKETGRWWDREEAGRLISREIPCS